MHRPFIVALLALIGVATTIQAQTGNGAPAPKSSWTAPRTPWGDPDLQGTYTNKHEQSTPFERPKEFEGRRLDDVTGAELSALLRERQQQVTDRAPGVGPLQFRDDLDVAKAAARGPSSIPPMAGF